MGQHYTLVLNTDISEEYLYKLKSRVLDNGFATEFDYHDIGYKTLIIEAKKIHWDDFLQELHFIAKVGNSQEYINGYQILIRGRDEDFQFYEYKFLEGKLIRKYFDDNN